MWKSALRSRTRSTPTDLVALLMQLTGIVHRRAAGDTLALMNEAGLTMGQMVALFILANAGEQAMGILAQKVHLSPAAATHMIEQLVRAGFVSRFDAPDDRRSKRIQITEKGRGLIQKLDVERRKEFAGVVAQLRPPVAKILTHALRVAVADLTSDESCGAQLERSKNA